MRSARPRALARTLERPCGSCVTTAADAEVTVPAAGPVRAPHRAWQLRRAGFVPSAAHVPRRCGTRGRASGAGRRRRLGCAAADAWDPPGAAQASKKTRPSSSRAWSTCCAARAAAQPSSRAARSSRASRGPAAAARQASRPGRGRSMSRASPTWCARSPRPDSARANGCFAARGGCSCGRARALAMASASGPSARTPSQSRAAPQSAAPLPLSVRTACCAGGCRARLVRRHAALPLLRGRPAHGAALRWRAARGPALRVIRGRAPVRHRGGARRRPSAGLHAGQKALSAIAVPAAGAMLQGCGPGGVGVKCKADVAPVGPACSRPSVQCACAKHSRRRPAQGFDLKEHGFCAPGCGDFAYDLVAVACHARKHIIAYVRVQGIFYRADDADVRCVGAHVGAVQADMRERAYTPRLVAYAARHAM